MSGRCFRVGFWVAAAMLFPFAAHAIGPGPGQSDKSGELILIMLAFPVLTIAGSAGIILISRPRERARILLRSLAGALVGLLATTLLGVVIVGGSQQDAAFIATTVLTLGIIPAGLIGLIIGGLIALRQTKPPVN